MKNFIKLIAIAAITITPLSAQASCAPGGTVCNDVGGLPIVEDRPDKGHSTGGDGSLGVVVALLIIFIMKERANGSR